MSSDEWDGVGMRSTRFVEPILRHLEKIVERFDVVVEHLFKRVDALPA